MNAIEELKTHNNWLGWKIVRKKNMNGDLKDTKVPIDPHTGNYAATDNPTTWSDFDTAKQAYKKFNLDGLGFVFTKDVGIVGIDLDNCVNPNGTSEEWALDVVKTLNSYTELSPSGSGLHILVKGLLPHSMKRDKTGIEMYDELRYFTITGKHWNDFPKEINKNQSGLTDIFNLYKSIVPPEPPKTSTKINYDEKPTPELISELLSYVPRKTDYSSCWLPILMSVHSEYPDATGIGLIENWSPGYDGEVAQKFRSFRNGTRVTIGTLFYFAKQYGWQPQGYVEDNDLDKHFREPLSPVMREDIRAYGWKRFHDGMLEHERQIWYDRYKFEPYILDMYKLGFSERRIDTETGEVIAGNSLTVPFQSNGKVVNVEYRDIDHNEVSYENEYPMLFTTDDTRKDCQMVVLPDSLTALHSYLELGVCDYNIVGLPHMRILKETIDYEGAVVLLEPDTDVGEYGLGVVRGHCWFNRLPFNVRDMLGSKLKIEELEWYIKSAKKI